MPDRNYTRIYPICYQKSLRSAESARQAMRIARPLPARCHAVRRQSPGAKDLRAYHYIGMPASDREDALRYTLFGPG